MDYSWDEFKQFILQWNEYVDAKVNDNSYTWNLEKKFQCYIDTHSQSLDSLYLYASMWFNGKNNPLTMSTLLYSLLESVDLEYINHDQIMTLNGSTYYNELIALVLEYISLENIDAKNLKEAEIILKDFVTRNPKRGYKNLKLAL